MTSNLNDFLQCKKTKSSKYKGKPKQGTVSCFHGIEVIVIFQEKQT